MLRQGETYALPRDISRSDALAYWRAEHHSVFVAEYLGRVIGTYYLRANQTGGGAHVANAGFVTDPLETGRGIARAMAMHALDEARRQGFKAMQFNLVVATNIHAIALWKSLGFAIVGKLPQAFDHPSQGLVDAFVMYRFLTESPEDDPA